MGSGVRSELLRRAIGMCLDEAGKCLPPGAKLPMDRSGIPILDDVICRALEWLKGEGVTRPLASLYEATMDHCRLEGVFSGDPNRRRLWPLEVFGQRIVELFFAAHWFELLKGDSGIDFELPLWCKRLGATDSGSALELCRRILGGAGMLKRKRGG